MTFRYYITDTFDGTIRGTDDKVKALQMARCEEYYVVDTKNGHILLDNGDYQKIEELK